MIIIMSQMQSFPYRKLQYVEQTLYWLLGLNLC